MKVLRYSAHQRDGTVSSAAGDYRTRRCCLYETRDSYASGGMAAAYRMDIVGIVNARRQPGYGVAPNWT